MNSRDIGALFHAVYRVKHGIFGTDFLKPESRPEDYDELVTPSPGEVMIRLQRLIDWCRENDLDPEPLEERLCFEGRVSNIPVSGSPPDGPKDEAEHRWTRTAADRFLNNRVLPKLNRTCKDEG